MELEKRYAEIITYPVVGKFIVIFIGIILIWILVKLVQRNFISRLKDSTSRYRSRKASSFAGFVLGITLVIIVFSDKLSGLTIALGVIGAGITFALQELITSFAGWLAVSINGLYRTGDRVELGGIKGDVMDIGMLRTTIMEIGQWVDGDLYNGRIVSVANSFVFKEPLFNYSRDFPFLWDEVKIPVQYGSDYAMANAMFFKIANEVAEELTDSIHEQWKYLQRKYLLEDARTEPMVSIVANDNWVEFTIRYVVNYRRRRTTKSELFIRLLKEIELTNGAIKIASATFQLVDSPPPILSVKDKPEN